MKTILATGAAAIMAASAAHAAAQEMEPRSVAVSYADLDLSRTSGRATLERRLEAAVRRVCSAPTGGRELTLLDPAKSCRDQAMAGARQQLARIYDARGLAEAAATMGAGKP